MKNGWAHGPKEIPIQLLTNGPNLLFQLLFLINCFLRGTQLPSEWTTYISNVYKKEDRNLCSHYRGLSVTNFLSRLYRRIIKGRIEKQIYHLDEEDCFCAYRSSSVNLFCLKQILKKRMTRKLETHMMFIDLTQVYGNVSLHCSLQCRNMMCDRNVQSIKKLLTNITSLK